MKNIGKVGEWRTTGNGEHLISSKSGKEGTMKIVYDNYYSLTCLWCALTKLSVGFREHKLC